MNAVNHSGKLKWTCLEFGFCTYDLCHLPKCYKVTNCYVKYIFLLFFLNKMVNLRRMSHNWINIQYLYFFLNWCKRWRTPFWPVGTLCDLKDVEQGDVMESQTVLRKAISPHSNWKPTQSSFSSMFQHLSSNMASTSLSGYAKKITFLNSKPGKLKYNTEQSSSLDGYEIRIRFCGR